MRTPNFRFSGSPDAIAAAGQATQAHYAAQAARAQAAGQSRSAFHNAAGQVQSAAMAQPGIFAGALGNNYQGYAGAMGNAFTAMANERSGLYGANAMAEAARMGALGNIGSAGLGAAGSTANAAMDAWARNQQAYNQSAATMHMANQSGLSNFGSADVGAQATLGSAQANAASRQSIAASLMGGLGGGMDSTFSASGPDGLIASGSVSGAGGAAGSGGGGGRGGYGGGGGGGGGGGINNTMQAELARQSDAGRSQLDNQHYSSRDMPGQMMDQGLAGLMAMSGQSTDAVGQGMDQFYGNQQRAGDQFRTDMSGALGGLRSGMDDSNNRIDGLFDRSLGNLPMFQSPLQRTQRAREASLAARSYREADEAQRLALRRRSVADRQGVPLYQGRFA